VLIVFALADPYSGDVAVRPDCAAVIRGPLGGGAAVRTTMHFAAVAVLLLAATLPLLAQALAPERVVVGVYITQIYDLDLTGGSFTASFWLWTRHRGGNIRQHGHGRSLHASEPLDPTTIATGTRLAVLGENGTLAAHHSPPRQRVQLSSDGIAAYVEAVELAFGAEVDPRRSSRHKQQFMPRNRRVHPCCRL
jgi:hypothetical protein